MTAQSIAKTEALSPRARIVANRRARAKLADNIATGVLWGVAGFISLVFAYLVYYIFTNGISHISWTFLTSGDREVGIGAQIYNTFYLLILSLIVMLPIGLGTAIYTTEYARNARFLSVLRYAVETLTSTPTLIFGLFGALFFVQNIPIIKIGSLTIHGFGFEPSRIAAALTLAILNVPWLLRTSQDAFKAVPNSLREASSAMGATKWQTTLRVVFPAAIPGLVTSILITSGRVIGETAALVFTAGVGGVSSSFTNPSLSQPGETLAYHAYQLFSEPTGNSLNIRLGTSLVLIILVLVFNLTARFLGNFLNTRFSGRRA